MDLNRDYTYDVESRLKGIIWVILVFFILVVIRLFFLQIVKGEYYRGFSENNSIRTVEIPAARGVIFDRKGEIIVDNRPVFDLIVIPQYISDKDGLSAALASILNQDEGQIARSISAALTQPPYKPYIIMADVSNDVVSRVRAHKSPFKNIAAYNLDGVDIQYRNLREYPEGDIASHVLGYVREVDANRLERLEKRYPGRFRQGDSVGVGGVEEKYDLQIRGVKGINQKIVDALGREVNYPNISFDLINEPARNGNNLHLTLDLGIQRAAKRALGERRGAIVALAPSTGAVLGMYSNPSYDLNRLHSLGRDTYWSELVTNLDMPLYNRAVQGVYPPASTYKIVTAIAALEEGVIGKDERINCGGGMKYGSRFYGCWLKSGHGPMNITDALKHSCDVFFYTMGLRLGIDSIEKYAKLLGLGAKTGIELTNEKEGLIPSTSWKMTVKNQEWNNGETLSAAIGQGYDLVTPLQLAVAGAVVANGGRRVLPHLTDKVLSSEGEYMYRWTGQSDRIEGISEETLDIVRKGLIGVVEGEGGTAGRLKALGLKIAGKTGTAQVVSRESGKSGEAYKSHAWFIGFAPYDDPKIVVAAIVEHGGSGSGTAAPVVAEVIKEYFGVKTEVAAKKTKSKPQSLEVR